MPVFDLCVETEVVPPPPPVKGVPLTSNNQNPGESYIQTIESVISV